MVGSDGFDLFSSDADLPEPDWSEAPSEPVTQERVFVRDKDRRPSSTGQTEADAPTPVAPDMRSAARGAGVGVIFAAAGAAAGAVFGGLWGAGAGLLLAGALRNGARARKLWGAADAAQRQEAATSATMAVIGGGAAVYLGYRARQERDVE